MLRALLESPGVIKGYDRIFHGSRAILNLERYFKPIIYDRTNNKIGIYERKWQ
jgi:hypothetical protein